MTLTIKLTKIELQENLFHSGQKQIKSQQLQDKFQLFLINKKLGKSDQFPIPLKQPSSKVLYYHKNDVCNFSVRKKEDQNEIIIESDLKMTILVHRYEQTYKNKRNKKQIHNLHLELKQHGTTVRIYFVYKYDRLISQNGSLVKLIDPKGNSQGINKFLNEFTTNSTHEENNSDNQSFIGLPDSPHSKIQVDLMKPSSTERRHIEHSSMEHPNIEHRHIERSSMEHPNERKIKFYKGQCSSKNFFSCCDQRSVEGEVFNIVEPNYTKD